MDMEFDVVGGKKHHISTWKVEGSICNSAWRYVSYTRANIGNFVLHIMTGDVAVMLVSGGRSRTTLEILTADRSCGILSARL